MDVLENAPRPPVPMVVLGTNNQIPDNAELLWFSNSFLANLGIVDNSDSDNLLLQYPSVLSYTGSGWK